MDENPYRSPEADGSPRPPGKPSPWHPVTWAIVGFAGGTLLAAPFIAATDLPDQIQGGMMFGGPWGALAGLGHGVERRRTARKMAED